jgi:DNA-binding beta-propeller fold protein YncE
MTFSKVRAGLGIVATAIALVWALNATYANANFEKVGVFGAPGSGEARLPEPEDGVAVDEATGDVYVADKLDNRVVVYDAKGNFLEAWGWGVANGEAKFQRCGPGSENEAKHPEYPACENHIGPAKAEGGDSGLPGENPGELSEPVGVAVDQATGNVYIENLKRENGVVQEFSSNGEHLLASFGQLAPFKTRVSEVSSELIHSPNEDGIAVDSSCDVYLIDGVLHFEAEARIMVFTPKTKGECEQNYIYAGQEQDIAVGDFPLAVAADAMGDIYVAAEKNALKQTNAPEVFRFGSDDLVDPAWEFAPKEESARAITVGASDGVSFVYQFGKNLFTELDPSGKELQNFKGGEKEKITVGLAYNPATSFAPNRPPGVLYATDTEAPLEEGLIFAPAPVSPPKVGSEYTTAVGTTSASLDAQIDPRGSDTTYRFEYMNDAHYQANHPDDEQTVTVSATGGTFSLDFKGQTTGGAGTGSLTAGSQTVSSLVTAAGTGILSAATGMGTVKEKSAEVREVKTTTGAFVVGQTISGAGIPEGTTIVNVGSGKLTLSAGATASGSAVALAAGSKEVTGLATITGRFVAGQPISGAGIPTNTTIVAATPAALTLSAPVTVAGTAVALTSTGPLPFAVGQTISGAGIPAGTTIAGVGPETLTLSADATVSASGVALVAGLPYDASAGEVRRALDGLSTISGAGGSVEVTGGPGDETGSAPYRVTFGGALGDTAVSQIVSDGVANALSGGSGSVQVAITNTGGGGFDGANRAPVSEAVLSADDVAGVAGVTLSGLEEGTTYHYRVVAISHCNPQEPAEPCTAEGLPQTFTTYTAAALPRHLPDGRAYELVSPPEKDGGEVYPAEYSSISGCGVAKCEPGLEKEHQPMQVAPDGNSVVYEGDPFLTSGEAPAENEYRANRSAGGWHTQDLSPSMAQEKETGFKAFSSDLSLGVLEQGEPVLCPEAHAAGYANLYLLSGRCDDQPGLQPLITSIPPHRSPVGSRGNTFNVVFAGASGDFSHVVFEANDALTQEDGSVAPAAPEVGEKEDDLYEWLGGRLRLVNVLPGNTVAQPGAVFGSGTELQTPNAGDPDFSYAISEDGSRIFWSDESTGQVYVRVNGEKTVEVPDPNKFLMASVDGSKVLLNDGRIYELNQEGSAFTEVADLTEVEDKSEGGFQGTLGASKDLSSVYFVDGAILTDTEENAEGKVAETNGDNLYLWSDGSVKFIATLAADDQSGTASLSGETGDWMASPSDRTAQVTPDGRYLAFMSNASLTGYDNNDVTTGIPDFEVYEYDADSGHLTCASCNPTDSQPLGSSSLSLIQPKSGFLGQLGQPHNLSDNGRLFFNSGDALSLDENGHQNVYEYEPDGLGSCESASGCVFTISTGHGSSDSEFMNATPSGSDVFFTTREQILPQDKDDLVDLYDAREPHEPGEQVDFPVPPKPTPCAEEATCRGSLSPLTAPVFGASVSAAQLGDGNLIVPVVSPKAKVLTRAQKLTAALKACGKERGKKKRALCKAQARKRYGTKAKTERVGGDRRARS